MNWRNDDQKAAKPGRRSIGSGKKEKKGKRLKSRRDGGEEGKREAEEVLSFSGNRPQRKLY